MFIKSVSCSAFNTANIDRNILKVIRNKVSYHFTHSYLVSASLMQFWYLFHSKKSTLNVVKGWKACKQPQTKTTELLLFHEMGSGVAS